MKRFSLRLMFSVLFALIATDAHSLSIFQRAANGSWIQPPGCEKGHGSCLTRTEMSCRAKEILEVKFVEDDGTEEVISCAELQNKLRPREIPLAELYPAGTAPLTEYLLLLNVLHHAPDLFTQQEWVAMTQHQIASDQQGYSAGRENAEFLPVFTHEQVKDRNAGVAGAELMPIFRAEALKRAAAAPRQLILSRPVLLSRYDTEAKVLTTRCCSAPDVPPNRFALLLHHSDAMFGRPATGFPERARSLAIYDVKENLIPDNSREPPRSVAGVNAISSSARRMAIVMDRRLELDGLPIAQAAAESLLNKRHDLKLRSLAVFEVTGVEKGGVQIAVYGRLVSAAIAGPTGMLGSFKPAAFPAAIAAAQKAVTATEEAPEKAKRRLDVVGIQLGMPASEVDKVVRAHMSLGWIYQRQRGAEDEAKPHQNVKLYMAKDLTEGIAVYLEPSIDGSVVAIRRQSLIGQPAPPAEVVKAELEKKYGPADGGKGNSLFWGGGGCVPSGTGGWKQRDLEHIEGSDMDAQTFQRAFAPVLDLMSHDRYDVAQYTKRYGTCEPKLMVLGGHYGIMTTLVDQKAAIIQPAATYATPKF